MAAPNGSVDERTPLLSESTVDGAKIIATGNTNGTLDGPGMAVDGAIASTSTLVDHDQDKPMPYTQVILLCFAATVDSVVYFAIFPIIGDMLVRVAHLDIKDISLWSGVLETLFSLVQMCVMIAYGKLADRIGRKPVLVFSLFGIAASSVLFGMAQSLSQMIIMRCITGFFAGSSVCVRSMLSEVTTKKTQARAFSWYMFAKNMGIFVGPIIGGTLANPQENIPLFKNSDFFKQFPFSLSFFATSIFTIIAASVVLLFVDETLKRKVDSDGTAVPEPTMTTRELLKSPGVMAVLLINSLIAVIALGYTAVSSVFYYTPVELGGFGLKPSTLSLVIALAGASQAIWMLGPFTPLQKRFGTIGVFRGCSYAWPVFMAFYPLLNEVRRHGGDKVFWPVLPIGTFLGSGVAMAFTCGQLAVNDIAPSPNTLGTLNALMLTIGSGIRAWVPVVATAIFEFGIKSGWLDGHLFWIVLEVLVFGFIVAVRYLPEKASGLQAKRTADDDDDDDGVIR